VSSRLHMRSPAFPLGLTKSRFFGTPTDRWLSGHALEFQSAPSRRGRSGLKRADSSVEAEGGLSRSGSEPHGRKWSVHRESRRLNTWRHSRRRSEPDAWRPLKPGGAATTLRSSRSRGARTESPANRLAIRARGGGSPMVRPARSGHCRGSNPLSGFVSHRGCP